MLDLLISYTNFLILSISYIVKLFSFRPPNPPKYNISSNEEGQENIGFLFKTEDNKLEYKKLSLKYLDIDFFKLRYNYKNDCYHFLPILIISPVFKIHKCIIYCQGNSGDLGTSFFECYEIALRSNCIIVTFEYPGYGLCKDEEITEGEFYRRIKRIYYFVTKSLKFSPNQIILYGFSLGTGITFDFACKKNFPVAGLILQSPLLSIVRAIYNIKKTQYFDLFNNCDKAKNLCTKTLFIHGIHDSIIPFIHGKILSKLIPKQYYYDFVKFEKGDHNNLLKFNKDSVFQIINNFISYCTNHENVVNNSISNDYDNDDLADLNPSVSNIEDTRKKISVHSSLIKSEYLGFNRSDDLRKSSISFENEKELGQNLKASSQVNYSLGNNLKFENEKEKENININNVININRNFQNELSPIKPCYNNPNYINSNIYENKSNIINNSNNQNNYYCVNLGTSSWNNNYGNNKRNTNNTILTLTRSSLIENSILSVNSSTNNIHNSNSHNKN
jgi:hypothetical protein